MDQLQQYIESTKAPWRLSLSIAFFLSGACSLMYQTVWIRKFSLIFGSTAFAMSVVIAVFFGGLAIGSHVFGRISNSFENPVRQYAILEILIGVYALVFPWILSIGEKVYAPLYPLVSDNFALLVIIRALISFAVLLLPTVLMGGTLPILARHFVRELSRAGGQAGGIYGLNALGAALGCVLTGYVFFQAIGVSKTNVLAGVINLLLGMTALAISSRTKLTAIPQTEGSNKKDVEKTKAVPQPTRVILLTIVCFGISGFVSMAYEMVWLRYILFFFRDTSYLYTGIITIFILGIALGSLICAWLVSKVRAPVALFGFLQMGIGVFTVVAIYAAIPYYHAIFQAGEGSGGNVLVILFALLIIPTTLMGATFPAVTKVITTELQTVGNQVGKAYALNTAGTILGTLAAGFFFLPVLGLQLTLYILFAMNMLLAAVLISAETHAFRKYGTLVSLFLCLLFPVTVTYALHYRLPEVVVQKISNNENVLEIEEGITGTTWAIKSAYCDVFKLLENQLVFSRTDSSSFLTQGYIPLLLIPEIPRNVLGLCFGGGLSHYAGRLFPEIQQFDFVDISKPNIDLALRHFPLNEGLKEDPRAHFIIDDAYNYLKYTGDKYELILMDSNPPTFSFRCAALYTKEIYQLARQRLTDGGYFTQVLPLKQLSDMETISVMKTFSSVFEHCLLWWNGSEPLMIGSNEPFHISIGAINDRLNRPAIQQSLKEHSKGVGYNILSQFLSGLLLVDEDFRKVAADGVVYTHDLLELEFSTGQYITLDAFEKIYANLSTWTEAKEIFWGVAELEKYEAQLTWSRQNLMKLLFLLLRKASHLEL